MTMLSLDLVWYHVWLLYYGNPDFVDTKKLIDEINKTLAYIIDKKPPHWETIVKEHKDFIDSIK